MSEDKENIPEVDVGLDTPLKVEVVEKKKVVVNEEIDLEDLDITKEEIKEFEDDKS